jgi:multiple sugar transport system substrate-binding protein
LATTACSSAAPQASPAAEAPKTQVQVPEMPTQPITLKVYPHSVQLAEDEFKRLMADPVKQKFPNVTLELMKAVPGANIEDFVVSGNFADIVFTGTGIRAFTAVNLAANLDPYLKRYNVDINRFEPQSIADLKAYTKDGSLVALPFSINFGALFYNKDIFDKFAVPYPKDGMTWDEAIALGKKLTRVEDGVQYYGLNAQTVHHQATQLSLTYVDPKTNKASFLTDDWKKLFQTYAQISELSTNLNKKGPNMLFLQDRTLAMFADYGAKIGQIEELQAQGKPFNWDMVTVPVYPSKPDKSFGFVSQSFLLSEISKNKEAAFQVINYLTSEENQLKMSTLGRQSSLQGQKFKEGFGTNMVSLKGKNIAAVFKNQPSANPLPSSYSETLNDMVKKEVTAAAEAVALGQKDVNTALRELEEKANNIYSKP